MSQNGKGILRRDRFTCQNCGAPHSDKVVTLEPPPESPFRDKIQLTTCKKCAPLLTAEPYPHIPVLKHLVTHGFTAQQGHPHLMAHVWAATTPMEPNPHLSPQAVEMLTTLQYVTDSIPAKILRSYNRDLSQEEYYRTLDELRRHAYILYNPDSITELFRFDVFTPPPITPDMAPLVAEPRTLLRLKNGPQWNKEPALLLAHMYHLAGLTVSGVTLRRLLRQNLPDKAQDLHAVILHKLLKYMTVVRTNPEGGWKFSPNFRQYTSSDLYEYLLMFYREPWLFRMPNDKQLAQGAKPYIEPYRDRKKRMRQSAPTNQPPSEQPQADPVEPDEDAPRLRPPAPASASRDPVQATAKSRSAR